MHKNPAITDSLHQADVFKGLTHEQYVRILGRGNPERIAPHRFLFQQGDPARKCYLVRRGRLKLSMLNAQGREMILRYVGDGKLTAAVAVLKDQTYPVTAESLEETEVTGWDKSAILSLMHEYPDIAINLLSIVLGRIDDVQHRYQELATENVERRIARSLLRLMRSAGSKIPEGVRIDIPLSRQNIADYTGTTLFTVSRTLSAWEKKGWIISERGWITIADPHALVVFTEGE